MSFTDAVKQGFELVKLNRPVYREVAQNPGVFTPALFITALAGLADWLSPPFHAIGFLFFPIREVIALFVVVAVIHFTVILLGGRGDYMALLRVMGVGWIIRWLLVVPVLGSLVGLIWWVVMTVVAVEELFAFDRMKAIVTVVVPFAAFMLLFFVFSILFGIAMLGFMGFSSMW